MKILAAVVAVAYPFLVYLGLQRFEPRTLAVFVGLLLALRAAALLWRRGRGLWRPLLGLALPVTAALAFTIVLNRSGAFLLVPVVMNGALLFSFGRSLRGPGPTMIETFARLQVDHLSAAELDYCRRVTVVWCAFFVANASACAVLAWAAPLAWWALYTGFVSYLLVGLLFSVELLYRAWRFRRYEGGWLDPVLVRVFPPRPTS